MHINFLRIFINLITENHVLFGIRSLQKDKIKCVIFEKTDKWWLDCQKEVFFIDEKLGLQKTIFNQSLTKHYFLVCIVKITELWQLLFFQIGIKLRSRIELFIFRIIVHKFALNFVEESIRKVNIFFVRLS